ncbi:hypothetical protein [Desulfovirgula thermocuniculi]|uniref:hypothetical protein n=1 Tax=Desulfovirgula thermocuniculi TaxID=348842 RepID=UPI000400DE6E|nr:hypothetical protein [Desulfovirgula thermocuniculi]
MSGTTGSFFDFLVLLAFTLAAYEAGRAARVLRGDKHMASAAHAASVAALGGAYLMALVGRVPQHWLALTVLLVAAAAALFVQAAYLVDVTRDTIAAARALFRGERKEASDSGEGNFGGAEREEG